MRALDPSGLAKAFHSIALATDGDLRRVGQRQSKLVTATVHIDALTLQQLPTRSLVRVLENVHEQLAIEAARMLAFQGYLGCPMFWADEGLTDLDGHQVLRSYDSDSYELRRRAFVVVPDEWNLSWYSLRTGISRDPLHTMNLRDGVSANRDTLCPQYSPGELQAALDPTTPPQLLAEWAESIDRRGERAARNPSLPTPVLRRLLVAGVWGAWLNPTTDFELLATPGGELLEGAVCAAVDAANLPSGRLYGAGHGRQLLGYLVSQFRRARHGLAPEVLRRLAQLFQLNRGTVSG